MAAKFGNKALIPNPALQAFKNLIGDWQTSGSHPAFPGSTLHGRASFDWHEGGAFVIMHSHIEHQDFPDGVAIFGSDNDAHTYYMIYFDERGISRKYDVTMDETELKWWRDDPKFSQRYTMRLAEHGNKITGEGEMSQEKAEWEKDLSLNYIRLT